MEALTLTLLAGVALILAYVTYGRWLARLFTLREESTTPAVSLRDEKDFVPTKKSIVFGHHFTSIAGTGPIVGPAIAVIWGWLPAILWVVFGSIFIGAVHDLGSLVVSLRNKGRTIGDIAGDLLGPRVRYIFLGVLIMGLWIVLAVFGLVIAAVLKQFPGAIAPFLFQIPLAVVIGVVVHRRGKSILGPSLAALILMYASVVWGDFGPLHSFNEFLASQPTWVWTVGLLAYAYVASVLPVWVLLQPRDYINALQLLTALALLVAGIAVAGIFGGLTTPIGDAAAQRVPLEIVAPVVDWNPSGAPPLIPILFITIACGAISGFHCLVGSGTTSKQLSCETHARAIGYGSMLTEGFLAVLVIVACAAGLGLGVRAPLEWAWGGPRSAAPDGVERTYMMSQLDIPAPGSTPSKLFTLRVWEDWQNKPTFEDATLVRREAWLFESPPEDLKIVGLRAADYRTSPVTAFAPSIFEATGDDPVFFLSDLPSVLKEDFTAATSLGAVRVDPDSATAHLQGQLAFLKRYQSWSAAGSLSAMVGAFVDGAANLIASMRIPREMAVALMGVLVASFAGTTMDTACRLQRYVVQELARGLLPRVKGPACGRCGYDLRGVNRTENQSVRCPECGESARLIAEGQSERMARVASPFNPMRWLATTHGATLFAVATAAMLAAMPAPGQSWSLATAGTGGLILWPLFGATNQLLAGLAFVVIVAWLRATGRKLWFVLPPMALMLAVPAWAMVWQAFVGDDTTASWLAQRNWALVAIASLALALEAWLVVEALVLMRTARRANA
ncbi:MAG: carbon starvation protein A [Phycisphaeraceae bacterium]|nr:carbon starvation protein A [Phycisphaeraceae bacterium]